MEQPIQTVTNVITFQLFLKEKCFLYIVNKFLQVYALP